MRLVLKNGHEVYHYWANEVQEQGRSGNTSFDGPKAYSYRRNIATIHTHKHDGTRLVLFDTSGYNSVTTSKHIHMARSAAGHLPKVEVPNCNPHYETEHTANLTYVARRIVDVQGKSTRARNEWRIQRYQQDALELMQQYDQYAVFFDRPERYSPEALAELAETVRKERARLKAEDRRRQKLRDAELAEKLVKWRSGESKDNYMLWGLSFVALRLVDLEAAQEGRGTVQRVQTSKGAEIPVSDAKRLWPMILKAREKGEDWSPVVALGPYRLSKIRKDGSIVVGCHDIHFNEIEGIAHQLGLIEHIAEAG